MKYLRYITIALFKLVSKIIGIPLFYIAVPFRAYARSVVYNYVLENKIYLPRLLERKPKFSSGYYTLSDVHNVNRLGYIRYRKVSKLQYTLVLWLIWIWVDDDSNHDTMSGGEREGLVYGNAFDLGDVRKHFPEFEFVESSKWMLRNTAYNFNYMFEEVAEGSKQAFYHRITTRFFDWHFGYIPYTNSVRKGRAVWFSEDIKYLDN